MAKQTPVSGLICNLLEPTATDGLAAWNFYDKQLVVKGRAAKAVEFPVARITNDIGASVEEYVMESKHGK